MVQMMKNVTMGMAEINQPSAPSVHRRCPVKWTTNINMLAGQTIMLAAKAMGYDSCPMIGFEHNAVAELINLPADHCIGPMIAVGKSTKDTWPKPGQLPLSEVVVTDRFGG